MQSVPYLKEASRTNLPSSSTSADSTSTSTTAADGTPLLLAGKDALALAFNNNHAASEEEGRGAEEAKKGGDEEEEVFQLQHQSLSDDALLLIWRAYDVDERCGILYMWCDSGTCVEGEE
jgi:hypothetical protein